MLKENRVGGGQILYNAKKEESENSNAKKIKTLH